MTQARTDWPPDCPHAPATEDELDFCRKPMVDWLAPAQLAATGVKAVVSSVFGAYADKREVQAALHPAEDGDALYSEDYSQDIGDDEAFWLDYAADLGDGFDSTYGIAWLLSRKRLAVDGVEGELPRSRLLVLGGDQVYPTANRSEYQDRFAGPYRAAFPWTEEADAPHLYAIPGNHDWYDGLTSFTRLFCQKRWIGGWKTRQKRSYFALKLPHGWWLWGTDIQLEADIDLPQMEFFQKVARVMQEEARREGLDRPRLLLCTAQPEWVYSDDQPPELRQPDRFGCRLTVDPDRYSSLEYFHREVIARYGIELAAMLSGDLHHYTRYERTEPTHRESPAQLITCGGAGAYLYPTHHMPDALRLTCGHRTEEGSVEEDEVHYTRRAVFPEAADSRSLGRWSWFPLPWRNWPFAGLLAAVYVLFAWVIQSASKSINGLFSDWWPTYAGEHGWSQEVPASLMDALSHLSPGHFPKVVHAFWDVMRHSPSGLVLALLVVFGLWKYRQSGGSPGDRGVSGIVHGLAHLLLAFWLIWVFSWINLTWFGWNVDSPLQVVVFFVEMMLAGGFLGGWLFGLYLMVTSKFSGAHINDVFSSQSLTGYKSFLRLRIDPDGKLHIYSVGVPEVPRGDAWTYRGGDPNLQPGEAWFAPPGDRVPSRLIEKQPIEIA